MAYGTDIADNFDGTGYKFLQREKFFGIRYDLSKPAINFWTFYATNMDKAYDQFGNYLQRAAKIKNYNPEEYFLFGNNRLLLTSLETAEKFEDGTNIT